MKSTQRRSFRARRPAVEARDDTGAVLVMALLFLIVGSLILVPLANWTANDLSSSTKFANVRSLQAEVEGVTQTAIQTIRYTPLLLSSQTLNASPPSYCWGTGTNPVSELSNINGQPEVAVWCSTAWSPASASTRVVTLSACVSSVTQATPLAQQITAATTCAIHPLLQAVVTFDDYASGVSAPSLGQCISTCGTGFTVSSWLWSPVLPTLSGLSPAAQTPQNPITGGTSVTISGTGFLTAEVVSFVEESGGVPLNNNVVVPATSFTVNSSTQITAVAPAVTDGTSYSYFVAVTTPTGTSAYGTTFTYAPVAPAITGLSTNQGATAGGSSETITGTGFVTGATVNFVQESGGVASTTVVPATYAAVVSSTSITAVSPAVTSATTYYVTVTTPQATSSTGPGVVFTYLSYTPTVASITPTHGASATSVTITGTEFVSNATVYFVQESGGTVSNPGADLAATVTAVGPTSITVTAPGVTNGVTYFPEVTNPTMNASTGTSDPYPIFTAT